MKLLFVNGCISQRGEESRTLVLARTFLDAWQARHPEAEVETVEPEALLALKPFAPEMLNDRDALAGIRCFDAPVYDLARQFRAADRVVVAAPFWDLTFPAALRTYIEYISANGLTYHYEADGCHGDCRAEKLAYLTSGGDLEQPESLGVLYWKQLCAMFGIPAFSYVFAGGLDLDPAKTEEILTEAAAVRGRLPAALALVLLLSACGGPPFTSGSGSYTVSISMHQKRNSLDRREERRRWLRRSSVWWGRRPAAKRSWVSCWQSGMTGKWFPPTPCRFTRA